MKHIERVTLALAFLAAATSPTAAQEAVRYVHLDAIGNVRAVSDQANVVIERHDYLPFGEECATGPCATNPRVGAGQPRKFTGKERDQETGLDYFGARYYGARIARFTTTDPVYTWADNLADPQRWNRYAYVRNNPLRYVDPDGRQMTGPDSPLGRMSRERFKDYMDGRTTQEQYAKEQILEGLGTLAIAGAAVGVEVGPALFTAGVSKAADPGTQSTVHEMLEGLAGGPPISPSSAASAANALRLSKQLASEGQVAQLVAGGGEVIAGAGHRTPIRDVPRLVATYGGEASDWAKVRSENFKAADGVSFETHAYRNVQTGQTVEPKTKFQ